MTPLAYAVAVYREAIAVARSQPALSVFTSLVSAAMVMVVLLTVGRTVAAQTDIVASIDDAGTRSIILRLQPNAQVTTAVLSRIDALDGVAWAGAFGQASDVHSAVVADGTRVAARTITTRDTAAIGLPSASAELSGATTAWATPKALQQLGLVDGAGPVRDADDADVLVTGTAELPDYLQFLDPVVLVPRQPSAIGIIDATGTITADPTKRADLVTLIVVVAEAPNLVAPLARAVTSVLGETDSEAVSAQTSEAFARLRGLIDDQLSVYSRSMLAGAITAGAVLVAATLYASVALRRKDYGRRRALGASQRLIAALVVAQATTVVTRGATVGAFAAHAVMIVMHFPVPRPTFTLALVLLAIITGAIAALVPAVIAARRDPLTELRVP
ncbi:hypothetical protein GCM10009785_30330 [Brooklawnia cerclae]|uniref:ABC transport system permease protein n=1 Tax=Brooklawnia cerclae TaxID=349934 RepID=A0ABX0SIV8_9ACTN|nr:ABC transporter permease [Brooklawnia cerclae]NIH56676.1 putative ABC transport system permease protein [Brooklawnia cerclae]